MRLFRSVEEAPVVEAIEKVEPVIETVVEAVATAVHSEPSMAAKLEQAMTQAVLQALAEGITDPQVIRDRKLAARTAVKVAAKS